MNKLFRMKWFPLGIQLINLLIFFLLISLGILANTHNMAFAKILRNTNLANLIVWSYWWPLIIIGSILFGRIWCMICPVELITSLSAKIGLKRKVPSWIRSGWAITLFYIVILFIGIHTFSIHRVPFRMAIYLVTLILLSVIIGLIFQKNAFCAYVCPVGHLLGLYARIAPFGWKIRDKNVCKTCKDKSCVTKRNIYNFQAKSCGVNLAPSNLDDNTNCLLCTQCLKACEKYNPGQEGRPNPGLSTRPFAKDLFSLKSINDAQVLFLLVVSGFVIYEILSEWSVSKNVLLWLPNFIQSNIGLTGIWATGLIKSFTLFLFLPLIIWTLPYLIQKIVRDKTSYLSYMKTFGIAFIPIMAAAHLIKAILKTVSRIPYWKISLQDPIGLLSAQKIFDKTLLLASNPSWISFLVTGLIFAISLIGTVVSVLIIKKLVAEKIKPAKNGFGFYFIPFLYGGLFLIMLLGWRLFIF